MDEESRKLPLSPYRALDLTDEKGFLCGKILGDLGADVIKIERPGGEPSRRLGPFFKDIPDPEKSLHWFAYNSNKRGITLNIETADGKEIFKELVKKADFIIESFPPGYIDKLGLGFSTLSQINPGLIMASITHFGQEGPYKDYKGCDIVDMAMGGYMYLCGDADRPPVRISFPQAYLHAAADAAAGIMIAFHHRQLSAEGQYVDISIQQSMVRTLYNSRLLWDFNRQFIRRRGRLWERRGPAGPTFRPQTWPCKDGTVTFFMAVGLAGATMNRAFVQWMDTEGMADDYLRSIDWEKEDADRQTQETIDQISERIARFFMTHTTAELYEGAKKWRVMLYPVSTIKDIAENPQLAAREFWEQARHPELKTSIVYPGAFIKSSETSLRIRQRPPLIGEHNEEVYSELGISKENLLTLKQGNII
ncbi:CaiB/BaiF CoA transferase family protein [Chloroflexota bacterium]